MKKIIENIKHDEPITRLFKEFLDSEKAGGILLLCCAVLSVVMANTSFQPSIEKFWDTEVGGHNLKHWINDGFMAIFFLLIGLELEREIYVGELSSLKKTMLPISAAFGGMLVPAMIYVLFNSGTPFQPGFGIPMATDIAFAIGIISMLGRKVPLSLKVFLTALAIVDDLGAILIIAIFYSKTILWWNLILALAIFGLLLVLNKAKVRSLIPFIVGGLGMWYFMSLSGVHATISGVMLAFAIPFNRADDKSPSFRLQHALHKPVAFFVLPVFALANTAILITGSFTGILSHTYTAGILAGLVVGKPLGILIFSYASVKLKLCALPDHIRWLHITGTGFLAGIGFTMSIFITLLAFDDMEIINNAKFAILFASLLSGVIGYVVLKLVLKKDS